MTQRSRRPLRVGLIGGRGIGPVYSGIETYYEEVGSRLAARGHQVTAYVRPAYCTKDEDEYKGIRIRRMFAIPSKHLETVSHSLLSTIDSVRQSFDIVQFHSLASAPFALLPRVFGGVTIASVRSLDWRSEKWGVISRSLLRLGAVAAIRCPNQTVVVSETLQDFYRDRYGVTPTFIPNAVVGGDRTADQIGDALERHGLERRAFLLYVGRIVQGKGLETLLEATRSLRERMPIVLAGGWQYTSEYQEKIRSLADDHVLFLGHVERGIVRQLMDACYAFVLPTYTEGRSNVLLEALTHGCCILTTAIPENTEIVGDAAMTFAPGDVPALRGHLERIVEDPSLAESFRNRALAHSGSLPDWDEITDKTEQIYYETLTAAGKL